LLHGIPSHDTPSCVFALIDPEQFQLLEMLEVAGCIVTTDAMHCRVETAKKVIKSDADYVFVVKDNQSRLLHAT
jgi:predicted transposase YbfD/YdcC